MHSATKLNIDILLFKTWFSYFALGVRVECEYIYMMFLFLSVISLLVIYKRERDDLPSKKVRVIIIGNQHSKDGEDEF